MGTMVRDQEEGHSEMIGLYEEDLEVDYVDWDFILNRILGGFYE